MRHLIFIYLFLLLGTLQGFSQNAPINFETGGVGANWTWTVFENHTNPPLEIVNNPAPGGINASAKVARFTALQAGNPWAGCESAHGSANLGPFVLNESNAIIKIMVWKSVISDVGIKLVSNTGWAQPEIKVANTVVNQWQELTFDFSGYMNPPNGQGQLDQIVIFPDFNLSGRGQDNIIFFDNITFNPVGSTSDEPTTPAPTPTRSPADVISLFSEAYTNVPVDTWRTPWSSAVLEDITIQGNATKKYSQLDFVGIETIANQLDITEMTHFHIDVWSPDFTLFGVKLVDFGANGVFGGGDDVEHQVDFPTPTQGQWLSLDIPLSAFTGLTTRRNIAQYILVGRPVAANTIFVDNLYFFRDTTSATEPSTAAPTPTRSPASVISLFSEAYTNVPVDTWRTPWSSAVLEDITIQGNATKKYSQLDFVGIETIANQLDITEMTHFHIDVWSPDFTLFGVKLVDFGANGVFGGGDDVEHQVDFPTPTQGQWLSLDIPLSAFTGLTTRRNIAQYILVGRPVAANTIFVDNVYFYNEMVRSRDVAASPNRVYVYPNPVSAGEPLQFSQPVIRVDVFDPLGKLVFSGSSAQLRTHALRQGVYFLNMHAAEGGIQMQRLVVR